MQRRCRSGPAARRGPYQVEISEVDKAGQAFPPPSPPPPPVVVDSEAEAKELRGQRQQQQQAAARDWSSDEEMDGQIYLAGSLHKLASLTTTAAVVRAAARLAHH